MDFCGTLLAAIGGPPRSIGAAFQSLQISKARFAGPPLGQELLRLDGGGCGQEAHRPEARSMRDLNSAPRGKGRHFSAQQEFNGFSPHSKISANLASYGTSR